MNPREQWLTDSLQRYLDRRSMPQGFKEKPQAIRDEIQALAKTLFRLAPSREFQNWWEDFSDRLAEDAKTRAWPTQGEMKDAAMAIRKGGVQPMAKSDETQINPIKVAATRLRAGEAVGEGWLWGRLCLSLQREEGVTDDELSPFRSALFFADRSMVGEEVALQREAERKNRHEAAKALKDDAPRNRHVPQIETRRMA